MADPKPAAAHVSDGSDSGENEKAVATQRRFSDPDFEDRHELTHDEAYEKTGFAFPTWKKWTVISVIFVIQCSMNYNASVYANAVKGMEKEFKITGQAARVGQCVFLVTYAFGCELWAPWSEEVCH